MKKFPKPWYRPSRGVWYVTLENQQINLGPDKDAAFERYTHLLSDPRKAKVASDSVAAITDAFLDWVSRHRSPETYEWYRYRLQRFLDRYPNLLAAELRPFHVSTWADDWCNTVTSRRNYLRSVKRAMRWAKQQGYISENPLADMEVPSADHKEIAISQDEFDGFMSHVRNPRLADLITITWETGCRPQESLIVASRHIDLANQRWVFHKSESKGKRISRVVYLTDVAMQITRRLMLASPEGPIFRNSTGVRWTTDAVNCGFLAMQLRMGKGKMQQRGITVPEEEIAAFIKTLRPRVMIKGQERNKNAAELRCEAKRKLTHKIASSLVPRYSLYAIRHSWATNALQRGIDPLTVAILMGHEDPSTLSRVYQHLSLNPEHMLNQMKKAAG